MSGPSLREQTTNRLAALGLSTEQQDVFYELVKRKIECGINNPNVFDISVGNHFFHVSVWQTFWPDGRVDLEIRFDHASAPM